MALVISPFSSSPSILHRNPNNLLLRNPNLLRFCCRKDRRRDQAPFTAASSDLPPKSTKLVTFLGKGGSGKTTSALLAAQYYAKLGLHTCLVIHSQDPTAEYLMGCKIGTSPTVFSDNLSAFRLETTKMLLEPLNRMKKADARLNLTQGVLQGVVGEELGVLPGMDSVLSVIEIEKLIGFGGGAAGGRNNSREKFDIIVYDGISSEETLRLIGAAERARWYLKYFRSIAEKTDLGRLTSPSLMKLADETLGFNGGSGMDVGTTAQIWDDVEGILEKTSAAFTEPSKFSCYLVMDPSNARSITCALRYWGCAIQAGAQISGAFGFAPESCIQSVESAQKKIAPLPFALLPYVSMNSSVDWNATLKVLGKSAQSLLSTAGNCCQSSVKFNHAQKSVTLFMPGFDKSEIKLFQMLSKGENAGLFKGVAIPGVSSTISHVQFADDILIMVESDPTSVQNLQTTLKCFEMVSGLRINMSKSRIFGVNCDTTDLSSYASSLSCSPSSFPTFFVGLPLSLGPPPVSMWDRVTQRFSNMLQSWKCRYLSIGGRLTLIKSALSNVPVYFMSLFSCPSQVIKRIEMLRRNFLWSGKKNQHYFHLLEWKDVCSHFKDGGASIRRLKMMNRALLGKWTWHLGTESDALWNVLIKGKYGSSPGGWWTTDSSRYRASSI